MKETRFTCCLAFLLLVASTGFAADDIPKQLSFARYQPILDHSPFAVATAGAPAAAAPDFAKDLFIANAAHSVEGDLVTLASSTDNNFKKYLSSKGPVDGYGISNIEWSERVGETKVTISKDGQFATLTFNQALLSQSLSRGSVNNVPAQNVGNPMQRINRMQPAPIPMLPTPPPHVRGMIPRNPKANSKSPVQPNPEPPSDDDDE
jgi:hypothetical protein